MKPYIPGSGDFANNLKDYKFEVDPRFLYFEKMKYFFGFFEYLSENEDKKSINRLNPSQNTPTTT